MSGILPGILSEMCGSRAREVGPRRFARGVRDARSCVEDVSTLSAVQVAVQFRCGVARETPSEVGRVPDRRE